MLKAFESRKYSRIHNYSNPFDEEKSKIKKETGKQLKYTRKLEKYIKDYLDKGAGNDGEILDP